VRRDLLEQLLPLVEPSAMKKSVVCGSNAISPDFTRAAKSRTGFIIP
jgi:hypothetical protein